MRAEVQLVYIMYSKTIC